MPPVAQLILKMVRELLSPMIHAEMETTTNVSSHRTNVLAQSHQDRLHGGEAVAASAHMPADTFSIPMFHCGEYPHIAVFKGKHLGPIGPPHQTKHSLAGHPKPLSILQSRPHLPMPFTMKGRLIQIVADVFEQLDIRNRTLGAARFDRCLLPFRATALRIAGRPY
jgi:hypothetical protein